MKASTTYFVPKTIEFLQQLAENNDRQWFAEHKTDYETFVLEPGLRLIEAIAKQLPRTAPMLTAEAKRQGGSLMRIYRDTRFSKNKDPYKTNIGIQFRHESGRDVHAPGCYVHVQPGEHFVAVGIWQPESPVLKQIRQAIAAQPQEWLKITRAKTFAQSFQLAGDSLKRPPQGFAADHPAIEDIKRKDFIGVCPLAESDILSPDLPKTILKRIKTGGPFLQFLCAAQQLMY